MFRGFNLISPSHAFRFCNVKDSGMSHRACQEKQRAFKRQKPTNVEDQITPLDSTPVKHGMGKGLISQENNLSRSVFFSRYCSCFF